MSFSDNLLGRNRRQSSGNGKAAKSSLTILAPRTRVYPPLLDHTAKQPLAKAGASSSSNPPGNDIDEASERAASPPHSVQSLANRWKCSEGTVRNLIRNEAITHFRLGQLIRISAEEVARFECQK